jgi:hypothetical protein
VFLTSSVCLILFFKVHIFMESVNPVVILAQHGLFLKRHTDPVSAAVKRSYFIRNAGAQDLDQLMVIEKECWKDLQLPLDRISSRLRAYPCGQWVCEINGVVVGVMYTQKLRSVDDLLHSGMTFSGQDQLHSSDFSAPVLQLLGVAVLPAYAQLQIGAALRDFVLQVARVNGQVRQVVAMTRCSSEKLLNFNESHRSEWEAKYLSMVASADDPTLAFHVSGGAKIVQAVPGYRVEDTLNQGFSVLIRYTLQPEVGVGAGAGVGVSRSDEGSVALPNEDVPMGDARAAKVLEISALKQLLVETVKLPVASSALAGMACSVLLDTPFMTLGLDSLDMQEFRRKLEKFYLADVSAALPTTARIFSPTLLFDFPTPRLLLSALVDIGEPSSASSDSTAAKTEPASESEPEPEHVMYAICGMGCRFPGDVSSPEEFHEALLRGLDSVSAVPKEWAWESKTQFAAFLSPESAETFDPSFFKLNSAEASAMDPHQRLVLEVSHEALMQAGVLSGQKGDEQVGVFVGLCNNEWIRHSALQTNSENTLLGPYSTTGAAQSAAANRLSFLLGLTGPSVVVDTACSSSLSALHTAMNALRCGDCEVALVAAADLLISEYSLQVLNLMFCFYFVGFSIKFLLIVLDPRICGDAIDRWQK